MSKRKFGLMLQSGLSLLNDEPALRALVQELVREAGGAIIGDVYQYPVRDVLSEYEDLVRVWCWAEYPSYVARHSDNTASLRRD